MGLAAADAAAPVAEDGDAGDDIDEFQDAAEVVDQVKPETSSNDSMEAAAKTTAERPKDTIKPSVAPKADGKTDHNLTKDDIAAVVPTAKLSQTDPSALPNSKQPTPVAVQDAKDAQAKLNDPQQPTKSNHRSIMDMLRAKCHSMHGTEPHQHGAFRTRLANAFHWRRDRPVAPASAAKTADEHDKKPRCIDRFRAWRHKEWLKIQHFFQSISKNKADIDAVTGDVGAVVGDGGKEAADVVAVAAAVGKADAGGIFNNAVNAVKDLVQGVKDFVKMVKDIGKASKDIYKAYHEPTPTTTPNPPDPQQQPPPEPPKPIDPDTVDVKAALAAPIPSSTTDRQFQILELIARKRVPSATDTDALEAISRIAGVLAKVKDWSGEILAQKLRSQMRKAIEAADSEDMTEPERRYCDKNAHSLTDMVDRSIDSLGLTTDIIRRAMYKVLATKDVTSNPERDEFLRDLLDSEFQDRETVNAFNLATFILMNRRSTESTKLSEISQIISAYNTVDRTLLSLPRDYIGVECSPYSYVTEASILTTMRRVAQAQESSSLDNTPSSAASSTASIDDADRTRWMSAKLAGLRILSGKSLAKISTELADSLGIDAAHESALASSSDATTAVGANVLVANAAISLVSRAMGGSVLCVPADAKKYISGIESGRNVGEIMLSETFNAFEAVVKAAKEVMAPLAVNIPIAAGGTKQVSPSTDEILVQKPKNVQRIAALQT